MAVVSAQTGSLHASPSAKVAKDLEDFDGNARQVFLITSQDGGVLFDLDKDAFLKLDSIAAQMWSLFLMGKTQDEVARWIADEYRVDLGRVTDDVERLLSTALQFGVTPNSVRPREALESPVVPPKYPVLPWYGRDPTVIRPNPKALTVIRALLSLALFDAILHVTSLRQICEIVRKSRVRRTRCSLADAIVGVCTAVERACVWYPKKAVCLQRSAITTCLLRHFGVAAKMVVGARIMPMDSHAWVEVDGSVVNDHPNVRKVFQPVARF